MANMNEFYSVKLRKKIKIPTSNIRKVIKNVNGKRRTFLVGKYKVDGKNYEAWKITA